MAGENLPSIYTTGFQICQPVFLFIRKVLSYTKSFFYYILCLLRSAGGRPQRFLSQKLTLCETNAPDVYDWEDFYYGEFYCYADQPCLRLSVGRLDPSAPARRRRVKPSASGASSVSHRNLFYNSNAVHADPPGSGHVPHADRKEGSEARRSFGPSGADRFHGHPRRYGKSGGRGRCHLLRRRRRGVLDVGLGDPRFCHGFHRGNPCPAS